MLKNRAKLLYKQNGSQDDRPEKLYSSRVYAFGRFLLIRKIYSLFQNKLQRLLHKDSYFNSPKMCNSSILELFDVDKCVELIHETGVYLGLRLPDQMVQEIYQYARTNPCTETGFEGNFFIDQLKNGWLSGERPVMRAFVCNAINCKAIKKISQDLVLLKIVRKYLGYSPTRITYHLTWTVASDIPEQEKKRLYPPVNFHYDVAGLNFMTAYFYITDVDASSGPHVMIPGSHHKKPLRFVLSSARKTDKTLFDYYNKTEIMAIEGKQGFGFVQDPSCYHKVVPPVTQHRLLLQIRYS